MKYIWYNPLDGKCELFDYSPHMFIRCEPSDSMLMIPPIGWDCE